MTFELYAALAALAALERTPGTLRALLSDLPPTSTESNERGASWSPYVIVGHMSHGEHDDWIPRASLILAQGAARGFTPYDGFAQFIASEGMTLGDLLDEFELRRCANLVVLREWQLTEGQLALEGEHREFGAATLRQPLATWVAHDLGQVAQIARDGEAVSRRGGAVARVTLGDGALSLPQRRSTGTFVRPTSPVQLVSSPARRAWRSPPWSSPLPNSSPRSKPKSASFAILRGRPIAPSSNTAQHRDSEARLNCCAT